MSSCCQLYSGLLQADQLYTGSTSDRACCAQAFLDSDASELILGPTAFEGSHLSLVPAAQSNALPVNQSLHGIAAQLYQHNAHQCVLSPTCSHVAKERLQFYRQLRDLLSHVSYKGYLIVAHDILCRNSGETSQPVSWRPIGDTQLTLTKQYPLNGGNKIAMRLDADSGAGGIINTGFWGISVAAGRHYELSLYLRNAQPSSVSSGRLPVGLLLRLGFEAIDSTAFCCKYAAMPQVCASFASFMLLQLGTESRTAVLCAGLRDVCGSCFGVRTRLPATCKRRL